MDRRSFLQASAAGLALSTTRGFAAEFADTKPPRVGLIGCGWYGKCDLIRLMQVAPVEVVSLCDVDKKMLAEAAQIVAGKQVSKKEPLEKVYQEIEDDLRHQYSLGFTPERADHAGGYRKIHLTTKQKGLTVQTREGYYAS